MYLYKSKKFKPKSEQCTISTVIINILISTYLTYAVWKWLRLISSTTDDDTQWRWLTFSEHWPTHDRWVCKLSLLSFRIKLSYTKQTPSQLTHYTKPSTVLADTYHSSQAGVYFFMLCPKCQLEGSIEAQYVLFCFCLCGEGMLCHSVKLPLWTFSLNCIEKHSSIFAHSIISKKGSFIYSTVAYWGVYLSTYLINR